MDGYSEKKWFVYLGDHHEGPFSLQEIQAKMAEHQVTTANYVWREGMGDWKVMTEVAEFSALVSASRTAAAAAPDAGSEAEAVVQAEEPSLLLEDPQGEASPAAAPLATEVAIEPEPPLAALAEATAPGLQAPAAAIAEPPESMGAVAAVEAEAVLAEPVLVEPVLVEPVLAEDTQRIAAAAVKDQPDKLDPPSSVELQQPASAAAGKKKKFQFKRPRGGLVALLILLILLGSGMAGYSLGLLDPVFESPSVKATLDTARDALQPQLQLLSEKVPALKKWVSPIPRLENVTLEEFEELKAAAREPLSVGPRVAVALSQGDLFAPRFHIASNLPDGAQFEVYLEGVPETLLNQLAFSGQGSATLIKKLGLTSAIRFPDGKMIPRGQYTVYVMEAEQQPPEVQPFLTAYHPEGRAVTELPPALPKGRKLLMTKSYFLGGTKDATYSERLKEFHDRLRKKASDELSELKQFAVMLEGQLNGTAQKFSALRGVKNKIARGKGWSAFHATYAGMASQFSANYPRWTEDALAKDFFYGMIYQLLLQAGRAVDRAHETHNRFFTSVTDPKTVEIQVGEAQAQARSALMALRSKIEQAEKIPPTVNGMPRREGL